MHLSASKSKEQRERKNNNNKKREQEILKFFQRSAAFITEAVRAAGEPEGSVANPGVFCQQLPAGAGRDWSKANAVCSLMS